MLARDIIRSLARIGAACTLFSILAWGQPALTTISDLRLKADGTPFNGLAQITWLSFDSASGASIAQQSTTVRIIDGNLFVQLTPTSNATPLAQYLVLYESDGNIQFQETWNVFPSTTPLRIVDVRTSQPLFPITGGGGAGGLTTVQESDVTGLVADLTARAVKGPAFTNSHTAIINDTGQIDGAIGTPTDCIHVDGTSGACGAGGSPAFSAVTSGTNTGALLVGSGGSLAPTGTGTITPTVGAGLAIVGNAAVTDGAVIPQKNTPSVFTAGSMQSFTSSVTLPPLRLLGTAFSDRTLGNFGFDTVSKRPTFTDGSNLLYGMSNPGTTTGDLITCISTATPCTEGVIAAGSTGLFLRANGTGVAPSYAIPNFTQIGGSLATSQLATVQGNGASVQLSTGTTTTNHCVKFDANGNTVDAGAACGSGGGGGVAIGSPVTGGTAGSVLYIDGSGNLAQNNSKFQYAGNGNALFVDTGIFDSGLHFQLGNVFFGFGLGLGKSDVACWTSGNGVNTTPDTCLSRDPTTAGLIDFGTTNSPGGTGGSWKATNGTLSGTLTYNGNAPPANALVCYKAGGVLGWVSAGAIGTTCN